MDVAPYSERLRTAGGSAGVLPDDPMADVLEVLADAPAETADRVRAALMPTLEAIKAFNEQAGQIAARPILTNKQVEQTVAPAIRSALNIGTLTLASVAAVITLLIGAEAGAWWQSDRDAERLQAAQNNVIALHDGFGTELKVKDAGMWAQLIRYNSGIAYVMQHCTPIKTDSGEACEFALWTRPPHVPISAAATH